MADPGLRESKLIQYLNEAFGKEKELETALQAQIAMATRDSLRKRLEAHLKETKDHARRVERRIKALGGKAETFPVSAPGPVGEAVETVQTVARKGAALAKGPAMIARGLSPEERMLKNVRTSFWNEHDEIANYRIIEALAESLHDRETLQLAKSIRREEERMASFLERQIPTLTRAVVTSEIPASERGNGRATRRRRRTTKSRSGSASRSGSTSRSGAKSRSRSTAARSNSRSGAKRTNARSGRTTKARTAAKSRSGSRSGPRRATAKR